MSYENRQAPEGINVTKLNPLTQFAKLLFAALILLVLLVVILQFVGGSLAKRVPFKYEKSLSDKFDVQLGNDQVAPEMVAYLNNLAERLAPGLPLTDGISVDVHYSDDDVFNAYATLGGNLLFNRGLLERIPNENALAMVVAHEMAHVQHRDPVASLGGGAASMLAVSMFTGFSGLAKDFFSKTYLLAGTRFTREMEKDADAAAVAAVNQLYGHVNGASALFLLMGDAGDDESKVPDWLQRFAATHPLRHDRIGSLQRLAKSNAWSLEGEITPLPADFDRWLHR